MNDIEGLVQQAHSLGACLWVEKRRVKLKGPAPLPADLMAQLREHKNELLAYLQAEGQRNASLDLPLPIGYGGLPKAQVEVVEAINDQFGITDPIHRKYNVMVWVLGYYRDRGENRGKRYEAIKREQERLGRLLDMGSTP